MANVRPKPVVLVIMDGWGIAPPSKGNGVTLAKKPVFDHLVATYPVMTLQASGEAVGLSWGEMGNSEVGHLNLGSGKIIYQTLPRINKAIESGGFADNQAFNKALDQVKKNQSRLHLLGLVSNGGVHSHQDHLYAILDICKKKGISEVYIHAILDGRDTKQDGALDFIKQLQAKIAEVGVGKIATMSGRFFAMDRDNHWDRIEPAFSVMALGKGEAKAEDPLAAISQAYSKQIYDEEFIPTVITAGGKPLATIEDKDAVIFFNFRADRARQITEAFALPGFSKFSRKKDYKDLVFVTLTEYEKDLPVDVAYPPELIEKPLARIIQDNNLLQLHAAETEKYAHVTFFFNGGQENEFTGESRILVPSPAVPTYDQKPEMSAAELNTKLIAAIKESKHDFIVVNYANPDMVGHTGVIPATIKAVETVDKCLGELVTVVLNQGGVCLVTADHGNAEELINLQTGEIDKEHSTNPVPFIAVGPEWEGQSLTPGLDSAAGDLSILTPSGMLADIGPTILKIMEIDQPGEMTGSPLI
ncbi:MAG: 2,3-bisphosphoglycerate-independent phosphoglycerate mutase [Candidatus Buchananbacteria bacterium]